MAKIICNPLNKIIEINTVTENLLWTLRKYDIPIASSCAGEGVCEWCKIEVLAGESNLSKMTENEKKAKINEKERLACQCKVHGNIEIKTSYW
jgi:2Fe-2S ferredoxin